MNNEYYYWHELEQAEEVKNMPVYPYDGSIKKIDRVVVIKISEV